VTAFSALMQRCGLSQREAAEFLDVRLDTVKSWCSGRNPTRHLILAELRQLYRKVERAGRDYAKFRLQLLNHQGKQVDRYLKIGTALDDRDAKALGFPCVGANMAAIGVAIAHLPDDIELEVVPRVRGEIPSPVVEW
jgi:hypothetical protein